MSDQSDESVHRPFVSCGFPNPEDPDMECLSRQGHSALVPHGVEVHPEGFDGPGYLVEWTDTEVVTDDRPAADIGRNEQP